MTFVDQSDRPRLLAVLDQNPFPSADGKSYPISNHLRGLAETWAIDILEVHRPGRTHGFETKLHHGVADRVFSIQAPTPRDASRRLREELLAGRPFFLDDPAPSAEIRLVLQGQRYDFIYTSPLGMATWGPAVADSLEHRPRTLININDSVTEKFRQDIDLIRTGALPWRHCLKHGIRWLRTAYMPSMERKILQRFDLVSVQTDRDRSSVIRDCGRHMAPRLVVAPNGIKESLLDLDYTGASTQRLVHIGASNGARGQLLRWFLDKVFVPAKKVLPNMTIQLAGPVSDADRRELEAINGVEVLGFVEKVEDVLAGATMSVAPLFMRSGLVNKVLDSLAAGVPCSGARVFNGFHGFQNGVHGFDVETADQWFQVLITTLTNPQKLHDVSIAGRKLVQDKFRWQQTVATLDQRMRGLDLHPSYRRPTVDVVANTNPQER